MGCGRLTQIPTGPPRPLPSNRDCGGIAPVRSPVRSGRRKLITRAIRMSAPGKGARGRRNMFLDHGAPEDWCVGLGRGEAGRGGWRTISADNVATQAARNRTELVEIGPKTVKTPAVSQPNLAGCG